MNKDLKRDLKIEGGFKKAEKDCEETEKAYEESRKDCEGGLK